MNLSKKILILLGVLLLTSCTTTPDVEPANEEQPLSILINRLTDHYTIEEIKLPDELIPDERIYTLSLEHINGYLFEANILNKSISHIFPIEKSYVYDLLTGELSVGKYNAEDNVRVRDVAIDSRGKLYELMLNYVDEGMQSYVNYEGEFVEGTDNLTLSSYNIRGFQKLNGKVYLLVENSLDYDHTEWKLYEFTDGKAEIIYNYSTNRTWGLDRDGDVDGIVLPPIQRNSNHQMAWVMQEEGKYFIQVFDGESINSYEVPICPILVITLTNDIYYTTYVLNDEEETVFNSFYRLNTDNGESEFITELDEELGMTYQVSNDEFYFNSNHEKSIVCKVIDNKLNCRTIESIPQESIIINIINIDEKTDLIIQGTYNDELILIPHLYIVHWE